MSKNLKIPDVWLNESTLMSIHRVMRFDHAALRKGPRLASTYDEEPSARDYEVAKSFMWWTRSFVEAGDSSPEARFDEVTRHLYLTDWGGE